MAVKGSFAYGLKKKTGTMLPLAFRTKADAEHHHLLHELPKTTKVVSVLVSAI